LIHKFGTVDAPVDVVRRYFSDIESWPQWMPTVRAVRILERSEKRVVAEIDRVQRRRTQTATFEFNVDPTGQRERQIKGPAKRWEADWRFQVGPRNTGTVVSCRLELDMGIAGLFAPAKLIQRWIDHTFDETLRGVGDQARLVGATRAAGESAQAEAEISSIRVFATPTELEIWIGDRKYLARAAE
jgi:ribosome-associated toxin RatA of RatAB toxin-antitoxin module